MTRSRTRLNSLAALACTALVVASADAQSLQVPAAPQQGVSAITNARIHTVSGPVIDNGYVLIKDGLITAVEAGDFPGLAGQPVTIINASGLNLYPGLIAADTTIGLIEIGAVRATRDTSETGQFTPEVRAVVAVNPDSEIIPVTRANGILTAAVVPQGGTISGYQSIIRLDGWTTEDLTLIDRAGLVLRWPNMAGGGARRGGRGGGEGGQSDAARRNVDRIDAMFRDAAAYLQARENAPDAHAFDARLEAFRPVLEGEAPIFIHADNAPSIRSAVAWADRWEFDDVVIVGAAEADQCAPLLVEHDIPVIIGGIYRMPTTRDGAYDEPFTLPARLRDAGVRFAIACNDDAAHQRNLPYHAAWAAAYGLTPDEALASVTLSAAEILGIGDSLGSIEPGKHATLILTDGHPLEVTTHTLRAWVEGSEISLGNKQKALYEKYRTRYRQMGLIED